MNTTTAPPRSTTALRTTAVRAVVFALLGAATLSACGTSSSPTTENSPAAVATVAASPTAPAPTASVSGNPQDHMLAAIDAGDLFAVQALLDSGMSPDEPLGGSSSGPLRPLHRAASSDQPAIVAELLAAGADVDARVGGTTPLMLAAASAGAETITALLDGGADATLTNGSSYGMSAIHFAGKEGNVAAFQPLLDAGVDINFQDITKTTALTYAAFYGQGDAVGFLLEAGADTSIRDQWKATAEEWAFENGFPEVGEQIAAFDAAA